MSVYGNRDKMWFGTIDSQTGATRMQWIPTPNSGADVSSLGMGSEATLLNGGGYQRNSWDSHKMFQFTWGESASLELASAIESYRNGSYGRGLIHFIDPMHYHTNVLPKRVADPSMAVNFEAEPLVPDVYPTSVPTGNTPTGLPVNSAVYSGPVSVNSASAIPVVVPPLHSVSFGWSGEATSPSAGFATVAIGVSGFSGGITPPIPTTSANVTSVSGVAGANGGLVIILPAIASGESITVAAMNARIFAPGEAVDHSGPWYAGQGHSGCRFVGNPTLVNYNGVDGGQVGLSCTLTEVGAWA